MGSCAAPSAKGDDKFITTDYLQQCRISLQHTQQLVLGSLAFMVVFLHWLTKPTKAAAGIGLANRKPCTVSQPACRNHARQSG
ncbi:hypothetical protein U9118_24855, partial [Escherichia coli]